MPTQPLRDMDPGFVHRPQRPLPPEPFLLDPEITVLMDAVRAWLISNLPGVTAASPFDEPKIWEVAWRLRELLLLQDADPDLFRDADSDQDADPDPLQGDRGLIVVAMHWWWHEQQHGDELTRHIERLAK